MQLQFVGYWDDNAFQNPDGSEINQGQPIYTQNGVYADGIWLSQVIFNNSGGLGNNPEIPMKHQHWFKKGV